MAHRLLEWIKHIIHYLWEKRQTATGNPECLFGHNTFSIFTACCYISDAENKMICESVIITNELSDHSRAAAITRVLTVIGIWEKNISIYYWKLTLLYGVMVVLHSSGSDSIFNCYQVLIHLWALRGAIMKNITTKSLRMALEEL